MSIIIKKILSLMGWQKLLGMTWEAVLPDLKKLVENTATQFDDGLLKIIDDIIKQLVNKGDVSE